MAIRDVVTRGYGNGTYDPGVEKVPTRGYTIGEATQDTGTPLLARPVAFPVAFPVARKVTDFQ